MRTTITTVFVGSLLLAALVTACGPSPAPPDTGGLEALDAQATLAVWSARETAVVEETRRVERATAQAAEANAAATRSAESATAQAIQAAGATAAAYGTAVAVEATATAGAGQMAATAQAGDATATWDALLARQQQMAIEATATADAAALAFQRQQADKALAARQAEIDRAEMWNRLLPWLVGTVAAGAAVALALAAGTWAVERLRRTRPQQAGDVWVMVGPGGPVALNRPVALNKPPALLPAGLPPAPITVTGPEAAVPLPEMRREHVLIAGETGSGKSHAMRVVLAARGERVVVLDPHYTEAEGWGAARVVGAGRDYEAIREYMGEMQRMLRERYEARAAGRDRFEPLTVAVDEMPSIVDAVGRDISQTWRQWLREGRKVGLYLVLSTQSTRVRTLGIEGEADLLENFTWVLALGDVARREWPAVVGSMARPAALVTKGRARPVVIPYGDNSGPHHGEAVVPLFTAPSPVVVEPDPDNMTDADRARVVAEFRRSRSLAAVQRAVFPSYRGSGGRAFYAIKDALVEAGELPPYREDGDGTSGLGPPPGYTW